MKFRFTFTISINDGKKNDWYNDFFRFFDGWNIQFAFACVIYGRLKIRANENCTIFELTLPTDVSNYVNFSLTNWDNKLQIFHFYPILFSFNHYPKKISFKLIFRLKIDKVSY